MNYLLIDYETRSRADLPAVGQHMYSRDESTEILCIGYKFIGEEKSYVVTYPQIYAGNASHFVEACKRADFFVAHNAPFEQAITKNVLLNTPLGKHLNGLNFGPEKWICTLSMASIFALPRGLDKVAEALNLPHKKDMEGKKLLMQMCKPRRPIQDIKAWIEWVETDDALKRLYEYCRQDLATEEALFLYLKKYKPFTDFERRLWVLDQKINQRGFEIDTELVTSALKLIKEEEKALTKDLQLKTFGWVKSGKQSAALKEFLADQGFVIPNVQKSTIDQAIIDAEKDGVRNKDVIDVLKIRQSLGKSSTSKYQAFSERCDTDSRVRDNLLYHGASTGRWSGAGVQPQNFPRGTIKISEPDFELVKNSDLELIKIFYDRPLDLLSSMLRGVIKATKGYRLFCADFSSIEARVLLWVAGDKAGLREYEKGIDPYRSMAAVIFGVALEDVTDEMRQLGKQVILACLEENTPVLVESGFKKICEVLNTDKVWNGKKFVKHGGVVYRGKKSVINIPCLNIESTPDHWFLTQKGWVTAVEIVNSLNTPSPLVAQSSGHGPLQVESFIEGPPGVSACAAYVKIKALLELIDSGKGKREPVIFALNQLTDNAGEILKALRTLSPTHVLERVGSLVFTTLKNGSITPVIKTSNGMAVAVLNSPSTHLENFWNLLLHWMGLTSPDSLWTELITTGTMSPETYELCLNLLTTKTARVFDIIEVEDQRFQVNNILSHNCGYQMGKKKFKQTCEMNKLDLPESLIERAHQAFRQKYPQVPQVWYNYEQAAIYAVQNKGKRVTVNKVVWYVEEDFLFAKLPSGRRLAYYGPELKNEKTFWNEDKVSLYHWGVDSLTKKWVSSATYGGKLTENIVQAISRDCMAASMLTLEEKGYQNLITVHDENLCEATNGNLKEFVDLMSARPEWGPDIPLAVKGWEDLRYRK